MSINNHERQTVADEAPQAWRDAPSRKVTLCGCCRRHRTFAKSEWRPGDVRCEYRCEVCNWDIGVPWGYSH